MRSIRRTEALCAYRSAISPRLLSFKKRSGRMRSIRRTEALCAYRSAISPRLLSLRRGAGECGAFVVPKHCVLTALPSLQDY